MIAWHIDYNLLSYIERQVQLYLKTSHAIFQRRCNSNLDTVICVEKFSIQKLHSVNINVDNQSSPINTTCSDFAFIQLTNQVVPVTPNQVIEKLSYMHTNTKDFIIIRYPNLLESSE